MKDIREEESNDTPLSTAALAHVDDRNPKEEQAEDRAQERLTQRGAGAVAEERAQERLARRESATAVGEPGSVVRHPDRPPVDGGPTLVGSGTPRTAEPLRDQNLRDQNRIGTANRPAAIAGKTPDDEQAAPLFAERESKDLFAKWDALQVGFIDEPRRAVEQADHLVAETMKRTAEIFAEERARLERQWDRGDNVSTEDLRVAMRRYRSFFRRLLTM